MQIELYQLTIERPRQQHILIFHCKHAINPLLRVHFENNRRVLLARINNVLANHNVQTLGLLHSDHRSFVKKHIEAVFGHAPKLSVAAVVPNQNGRFGVFEELRNGVAVDSGSLAFGWKIED